jgi:hypothetical protein
MPQLNTLAYRQKMELIFDSKREIERRDPSVIALLSASADQSYTASMSSLRRRVIKRSSAAQRVLSCAHTRWRAAANHHHTVFLPFHSSPRS